MITSIAHAIGLDAELATLDPLPTPSLDIVAFHHMRLIKNMRDAKYSLMISNKEVPSVVLPCLDRTNMQNRENWIYNLNIDIEVRAVPMDIPKNVNTRGGADEKYDQREQGSLVHEPPPHHSPHIHVSPTHTTPYFSNTFTSTSRVIVRKKKLL